MPNPHTYRELVRILKDHDKRFQFIVRRGKGSHRMIVHPDIGGREASYPVKCHGGGTELSRGTIAAIARRFNLPDNLL